jgi:hypothetical protein
MKPHKILLWLLAAIIYLLHQDFWNWRVYHPLVFGFLPVGLAYHAAYSILAAVMMAVFVKYAWPKKLETVGARDEGGKDVAQASSLRRDVADGNTGQAGSSPHKKP